MTIDRHTVIAAIGGTIGVLTVISVTVVGTATAQSIPGTRTGGALIIDTFDGADFSLIPWLMLGALAVTTLLAVSLIDAQRCSRLENLMRRLLAGLSLSALVLPSVAWLAVPGGAELHTVLLWREVGQIGLAVTTVVVATLAVLQTVVCLVGGLYTLFAGRRVAVRQGWFRPALMAVASATYIPVLFALGLLPPSVL